MRIGGEPGEEGAGSRAPSEASGPQPSLVGGPASGCERVRRRPRRAHLAQPGAGWRSGTRRLSARSSHGHVNSVSGGNVMKGVDECPQEGRPRREPSGHRRPSGQTALKQRPVHEHRVTAHCRRRAAICSPRGRQEGQRRPEARPEQMPPPSQRLRKSPGARSAVTTEAARVLAVRGERPEGVECAPPPPPGPARGRAGHPVSGWGVTGEAGKSGVARRVRRLCVGPA